MKVYNKLVRDKIPEIIKNKGQRPVTRIADEEEYHLKLIEKLREEISEYEKNKNNEELADMLEVIYSITKIKNLTTEKLEEIRNKKSKERGSFDDRIILEKVE